MALHTKLLGTLLILYWSCWFPIRKNYHFHQKIICPYNWYIPIKTKIYDKRTYVIHFFLCQIKTRCMNTCTQRLTEVYRYPSLFIAKYSLVWTPWIATTRRPTGMRLNRAEISKMWKCYNSNLIALQYIQQEHLASSNQWRLSESRNIQM